MRTTEDRASASWSDEHLVTAALSGDVEAFAAIYDRYADALFNACYRQLGNREEAADVVQDTFVLAKEELPRLRDARRLRSWLFTIATRQALWVIRSRARSSPTDEFGDIVEDDAGPEEQAERSEIAVLLRAAGEGLSPTERSVLGLYLSGLTNAEIAQAVGLRLQAVHVCLHRLRGQVESSLGALLILRRGHRDCDGLAAAVGAWDGQFSPLVRKRVARHVRDCETCGSRQARLLTREALLGLIPWLAVPDEIRARVLDHVRPALFTGAVPAAVGPVPSSAPLLGRIRPAPAAPPPSGAGVLVKVGGAAAVLTLLIGIGAMRAVERPEPETAAPQAATQTPPAPALVPAPVVPPASGSAPSGSASSGSARGAATPAQARATTPATPSAPKSRTTTGRITTPAPAVSEPVSPAGTAPVDPAGLRTSQTPEVVPAAPEQVPAIAAVAPQPAGGVGVSTVPAGAPVLSGATVPAAAPAAQPQAGPAPQPQAAADGTGSDEPGSDEPGSETEPSGQPVQSAETRTQPVPVPDQTVKDAGASPQPSPGQAGTQPPPAPEPQPQPAPQPPPTAQPAPVTQPRAEPDAPGKEGARLSPEAEAEAEARRAEETELLTSVAGQEGITGQMQEDGTFLADNGMRLEVVDGQVRAVTEDEGTGSDTPEIREDGSWVNDNGDIMELGPTGEPRVRTLAEDVEAEDVDNGLGATTADGEQQPDCPETGCEAAEDVVTGAADALGQGIENGVNGQDTGATGEGGDAATTGTGGETVDQGRTADPDQVAGNGGTTLDPARDDWWQDLNGQPSQSGGAPVDDPSADPTVGLLGGSFPVEPAPVTQQSGPR